MVHTHLDVVLVAVLVELMEDGECREVQVRHTLIPTQTQI